MNDQESEDQQDPKIIVDTDWKEQVAKEKEAAGEEAAGEEAVGEIDSSESQTSTEIESQPTGADEPSERALPPPPPASFEVLVSMLFTQAMSMLGQMPDPASGETTVHKTYAKHYIDTLDMLDEKTKGNLSENESKILSEALHALRMAFVSVKES